MFERFCEMRRGENHRFYKGFRGPGFFRRAGGVTRSQTKRDTKLPNQARYQTEDNPDDVQFCCRGRIQTALQRNYSGVIIQDGSEKSNGFFPSPAGCLPVVRGRFFAACGGVRSARENAIVCACDGARQSSRRYRVTSNALMIPGRLRRGRSNQAALWS